MLLEFQALRLGRSGNSTARPCTNTWLLTKSSLWFWKFVIF